jgi:hypothetical protein
MGDKLGTMVKKYILSIIFIFTVFVNADETPNIEKYKQNAFHIKENLSLNKKAKIYKVIASSDDLSLRDVRIDKPKKNNIKLYRTPTKRDKFIIKILDEDYRELSVIGLKNPFYLHLQHQGYEDSHVFGGYVKREFNIPIPIEIDAKYISLHSQNQFGFKEIKRIKLK